MSAAATATPAVAVVMASSDDEMTGRVLGKLCRASCGNGLPRALADVHDTNSRYANGALFVILLRCHESTALLHEEDDTSANWTSCW